MARQVCEDGTPSLQGWRGAFDNHAAHVLNNKKAKPYDFAFLVGAEGFVPTCRLTEGKNPRPSYTKQGAGLSSLTPYSLWALRDSNPRPSACKADALNQLS